MSYGLYALARAGRWHVGAGSFTPGWIAEADIEAHGGRGYCRVTDDPSKALEFEDASSAQLFYLGSPKSRPIREDGRPNRPLTAFTVAIQEIPAP